MASRPKQAEPRPAPRLYLITLPTADTRELTEALGAALRAADVAAVLLRLKDADERSLINRIKEVSAIVQATDSALLLDGHADLVARSGADGAHLSSIDDFSVAIDQLKPDRIAGIGGLASRHDAMTAAEASADYLMFGTPGVDLATTEERIRWSSELFELPCVAYANNIQEIAPLIGAGADFIALDFVWHDPRGAAAALAEIMERLRLPESVS